MTNDGVLRHSSFGILHSSFLLWGFDLGMDLFEGGPEGGVFGVAVEEDFAAGVDEDHARDAVDLEELREGALGGLDEPGDFHVLLFADALGDAFGVFVIFVHGDDGDAVRFEQLALLFQRRHELHARAAPRGPEVDEDGFLASDLVAERGGLSHRGGHGQGEIDLQRAHFILPPHRFDGLGKDLRLRGIQPHGLEDVFLEFLCLAFIACLQRADVGGKGFHGLGAAHRGAEVAVKTGGERLHLRQHFDEVGCVLVAQAPDEARLDDLLLRHTDLPGLFGQRIELLLGGVVAKEALQHFLGTGRGGGADFIGGGLLLRVQGRAHRQRGGEEQAEGGFHARGKSTRVPEVSRGKLPRSSLRRA